MDKKLSKLSPHLNLILTFLIEMMKNNSNQHLDLIKNNLIIKLKYSQQSYH